MVYSGFKGPDKPNRGKENGACDRQRCQAEPAIWYNHVSRTWYCKECRHSIQFDYCNLFNWKKHQEPHLGHPMFETRAMIDERLRSDNQKLVAVK